MLDGWMRRRIDRPLNLAGQAIARRGISAAQVTLAGLAAGLGAALLIALGAPGWAALALLGAGRIADGLDGAVARAAQDSAKPSDFGGFLDIFCDIVFYAAVPLAFALRDPANGVAAAALLASFYINAASFLGFAILAEKRGLQTRAQGLKSLYYSAGLMEGSETIAFFTAFCLWPHQFQPLALLFAALCLLTALARAILARRQFGP